MFTPWHLLIRWFIAARHVYPGVQACAVGLARSPCQPQSLYPSADEIKISYLIDCTTLPACMCTQEISGMKVCATTADNAIINHWRKMPQILVGLGRSNLNTNHNWHICPSLANRPANVGISIHSLLKPCHSLAVDEKQMQNGKGGLATVELLGILVWYYIQFLSSTEMIFMTQDKYEDVRWELLSFWKYMTLIT